MAGAGAGAEIMDKGGAEKEPEPKKIISGEGFHTLWEAGSSRYWYFIIYCLRNYGSLTKGMETVGSVQNI